MNSLESSVYSRGFVASWPTGAGCNLAARVRVLVETELASWCFEPSQSPRIISRLSERGTFSHFFRVTAGAGLSVPALPSGAKHALWSLRTLKIPSKLLD